MSKTKLFIAGFGIAFVSFVGSHAYAITQHLKPTAVAQQQDIIGTQDVVVAENTEAIQANDADGNKEMARGNDIGGNSDVVQGNDADGNG